MQNVLLENYLHGKMGFVIKEDKETLAKMEVLVKGDMMTVFHTEVAEKEEGKGLGKILFQAMVDHARQHRLKVNPLCVFVLAQLERHPEMYSDVWQKKSV